MDMEIIILSEMTQTQKEKECDQLPHIPATMGRASRTHTLFPL